MSSPRTPPPPVLDDLQRDATLHGLVVEHRVPQAVADADAQHLADWWRLWGILKTCAPAAVVCKQPPPTHGPWHSGFSCDDGITRKSPDLQLQSAPIDPTLSLLTVVRDRLPCLQDLRLDLSFRTDIGTEYARLKHLWRSVLSVRDPRGL